MIDHQSVDEIDLAWRKLMKKLALVLWTTFSLNISSGAIADEHSKPMNKAAAVLDQTIADGRLNFAVAAVGNAGGRPGPMQQGIRTRKKPTSLAPTTLYRLPR